MKTIRNQRLPELPDETFTLELQRDSSWAVISDNPHLHDECLGIVHWEPTLGHPGDDVYTEHPCDMRGYDCSSDAVRALRRLCVPDQIRAVSQALGDVEDDRERAVLRQALHYWRGELQRYHEAGGDWCSLCLASLEPWMVVGQRDESRPVRCADCSRRSEAVAAEVPKADAEANETEHRADRYETRMRIRWEDGESEEHEEVHAA